MSETDIKLNPDEIAWTAHALWEFEGREPGRDEDYWLQAEQLLFTAKWREATGKFDFDIRPRIEHLLARMEDLLSEDYNKHTTITIVEVRKSFLKE